MVGEHRGVGKWHRCEPWTCCTSNAAVPCHNCPTYVRKFDVRHIRHPRAVGLFHEVAPVPEQLGHRARWSGVLGLAADLVELRGGCSARGAAKG